jgi:hypothetical protein
MASKQRGPGVGVGYAAALWSAIFAILHFVWATGWYVGLRKEEAEWAFSRRWFWIYDIVVAGTCTLGVVVALALVEPWGRRVPRWPLIALAWIGTGLLWLRGGGAVLQTAYLLITREYAPDPMHLYSLWFCLGAVLFTVALRRFGRITSST